MSTIEKPLSKKAQKEQELREALKRLHKYLQPGDTVSCILRHRSASGMSRRISFAIADHSEIVDLDWLIARVLDYRIHKDGGLVVGGCGMDMGFHMVYNLGRVMFPDGFECAGEGKDDSVTGRPIRRRCPSNDHSNGDRNFQPHHHADGGYAFRSTWL